MNGMSIAVARIVLEAISALAVSTGQSRSVFDSELATDWNHLPMIPGTTLAGVVRSRAVAEDPNSASWFGSSDDEHSGSSSVHCSHGLLQGSRGQVLECLDLHGAIDADPVWSRCRDRAKNPTYRHGVRLSHRGVVDGDGKFDVAILGPGHRFTVEIRACAETPEEASRRLQALLQVMQQAGFALGRRTRSGLGAMALRDVRQTVVPMPDLGRIDPRLSVTPDWPQAPVRIRAVTAGYTVEAAIESGWILIGGGRVPLGPESPEMPDQLPYSDECLVWTADGVRIEHRAVIPGSAFRGPLRHRTLFHLRCLLGRFRGDPGNGDDGADEATHLVAALFGGAADDASAHAGQLWFPDVLLDPANYSVQDRTRTSIDRFSGGVRSGRLFRQQVLHLTQPLKFTIGVSRGAWEHVGETVRLAFERALRDLTEGLLPIGGSTTNGCGALVGSSRYEETRHDP